MKIRPCAISLVHGARIPPKEPRWFRPDWPERVSNYFTDRGISQVTPYYWSGDVLDAFSPSRAGRYAEHIIDLHEKTRGPVYIICKSLGFAVVESGLAALAATGLAVPVERLIRIVPPDGRRQCHVPMARRVIDFVSSVDLMHLGATLPVTALSKVFFRHHPARFPGTQRRKIPFKIPDHTSFNFDNPLPPPYQNLTMFTLYHECLFGAFCQYSEKNM